MYKIQANTKEANIPLIVVLINGGTIAISWIKSNADAISSEARVELSSMKESAALAEDPTANSDFENRFDASVVDAPSASSVAAAFDGDFDSISNISSQVGFYPNLFKQLNLTIEDPRQRLIAGHFVNALEPTGWIGMSVSEIAKASGSSEDEAESVGELS